MTIELSRRSVTLGIAATFSWAGLLGSRSAFAQDGPPRELDVPYVPTPEKVVEKMLELAKPTRRDYLIDLGCGDGRIPVTAAKKYGVRGMGVDLNPVRIREAKANAEKSKVTNLVTFQEGDLFKFDFTKATILTLYLLPTVNLKLRPQILDMKAGTRVVSHDFDMGDWKADRTEKLDYKTVYYWVVPAKVAGKWNVRDLRPSARGRRVYPLELTQKYQELEGKATIAGTAVPIRNAKVSGTIVDFEYVLSDKQVRKFSGRLIGDRIVGNGWWATKA